jgi:hypothetical protein
MIFTIFAISIADAGPLARESRTACTRIHKADLQIYRFIVALSLASSER